MTLPKLGVLLTNIGSPDSPTPKSVRKYLQQFLSDPRVVNLPKIIWWPLLYGFILRTRPRQSAELYQQIWQPDGAPLIINTQKIADRLQSELNIPVEIGMHYGNPSISTALEKLVVQKIIVLPLFPQYSATTTAVTFDRIAAVFKKKRAFPEISTTHHYAMHPNYINAICQTIKNYPIQHLVFSFHGLPQHHINHGDPYFEHCQQTVENIVKQLQLSPKQWSLSFQSRLGRGRWLTPYTHQLLQELPQRGINNIHVICPGFAVDCLETLEEIAIRGKKQFLLAGGHSFEYIPALNEHELHIQLLREIIRFHW